MSSDCGGGSAGGAGPAQQQQQQHEYYDAMYYKNKNKSKQKRKRRQRWITGILLLATIVVLPGMSIISIDVSAYYLHTATNSIVFASSATSPTTSPTTSATTSPTTSATTATTTTRNRSNRNRNSTATSQEKDDRDDHIDINNDDIQVQLCRLELEQWLNPKIDEWLEAEIPILDWVWELEEEDEEELDDDYSHVDNKNQNDNKNDNDTNDNDNDNGRRQPRKYHVAMFVYNHLKKKKIKSNDEQGAAAAAAHQHFREATWYCEDGLGNQGDAILLPKKKNKNNNKDEEKERLIISKLLLLRCDLVNAPIAMLAPKVTETHSPPPPLLIPDENDNNNNKHNQTMTKTTTQMTPADYYHRYDLRPMLKCDSLEKRNPPAGQQQHDVKIGACLRFRGGHDQVRQWIDYHRLIGIQHFWLFVNEPSSSLRLMQDLLGQQHHHSDITYIPYNYVWSDHKKYTNYKADFGGKDFWQVPAQNQCLYRAKRYGLDWITTTDVDEYIWIEDLEASRTSTITSSTDPLPLAKFLSNFTTDLDSRFAGLTMRSVPFGGNGKTPPGQEPQLLVDYTYRQELSEIGRDRRKQFFRVAKATEIDIHWIRHGGKEKMLNAKSQARLNHYKSSNQGVYYQHNGHHEYLSGDDLVHDSSLPNMYRDRIIMEDLQIPNASQQVVIEGQK